MDSVHKKLVDQHKRRLDQSAKFKCACCSGIYDREQAAGVRVYVPKGELIRIAKPTTYVLCKECDELPDEKLDSKIAWTLAQAGTFF